MSNSATIFVQPAQRGRPVVRGEQRETSVPARLTLVPAEPVVIAPSPKPASPSASPSIDARFTAILDREPAQGETLLACFACKETELRAAFASMTVDEARALHKRLSTPQASDTFAQKFKRLTADRRARLINFLADARRRAALATGKR